MNELLDEGIASEYDEDWFVTIHVCIENAASGAIEAADKLSECNEATNEKDLHNLLSRIQLSLNEVNKIFLRMTERCDPYIYYHRVRPFIFGSKDNPDLKNGLIYESQFANKAQFFRGETGAQSSIVPAVDALLGINHSEDPLRIYLDEMRDYMPFEHRQLLNNLDKWSNQENIKKKRKNHSTHDASELLPSLSLRTQLIVRLLFLLSFLRLIVG